MPVNIRIEPILPTEKNYPLDTYDRLRKKLKRWLKEDAGKTVQEELKKTVKNWSSAPAFPIVYSEPYGTRLQIVVAPKGKGTTKWKRVSQGTGPRDITPRNPDAVMVFPLYYDPKTTPGGKYGGPGEKFGPIVRTKQVHRHRIAPREFSKKIKEDIEPRLQREAIGVVKNSILRK